MKTLRYVFGPTLALALLVACGGDDGEDTATPMDLGPTEDAAPTDGGTNEPPVSTDLDLETYTGVPVDGLLEASDPDGDTLTFEVAMEPADGAVSLVPETGAFTYTPNADFVGDDSFTFVASDGALASDPATVAVTVNLISDGTEDASFGTGGVSIVDPAASTAYYHEPLVLDDGRIAVAATTGTEALLAMHLPDGSLDPDVGSGGFVTADPTVGEEDYFELARQSDGAIVAVGRTDAGDRDWLLARYDSDGTLDTSFGTDGYVRTDFAGGRDDGRALTVMDDDGLLVTGRVASGAGDADFGVARFDADGSLDTTFGTDGLVFADFEGEDDIPASILVDGTGRIVVGGFANTSGGDVHAAVVRLEADGTVDTGFGGEGWAIVDTPDFAGASAVLMDDGGNLWLGGSAYSTDDGGMLLARFDTDGSLDTTFDDDGWMVVDFPTDGGVALDMLAQPNGTLLLAGYQGGNAPEPELATIAAVRPDGSLDASFGDDGIWTETFTLSGESSGLEGIAMQPDGKLVATGQKRETTVGADTESFVVRLAR